MHAERRAARRGGGVHVLRMASLDRPARRSVRSARLHASRLLRCALSPRTPVRTASRSCFARSARTSPTRCIGARGDRSPASRVHRFRDRACVDRVARATPSAARRFRSRRFKATSRNRSSGTRSGLAVRRYTAMTRLAGKQASTIDRLARDGYHQPCSIRTRRSWRAFRNLARDVACDDRRRQPRRLSPGRFTTRSTSFHRTAATQSTTSANSCRSPNGFRDARFSRGCHMSAALNGGLSPGKIDGVYPTRALTDCAADLLGVGIRGSRPRAGARGAQLLVVSTDDAWFGTTSGPYMHAQIAQLRAIESGAYVVRAAATGISGIIRARWHVASAQPACSERTVVAGKVGPRVDTVLLANRPDRDWASPRSAVR